MEDNLDCIEKILSEVLVIEYEKNGADMAPTFISFKNLFLETVIEFPHIMKGCEEGETLNLDIIDEFKSCKMRKPLFQNRGCEKNIEAGRNIGAMISERMPFFILQAELTPEYGSEFCSSSVFHFFHTRTLYSKYKRRGDGGTISSPDH